jgi:hypothetical protein
MGSPAQDQAMTGRREAGASRDRRVGLATLLVAVCLFFLACYHGVDQWQLNRTGLVVEGEVIAASGKQGRNPTVRFEAPDGTSHVFIEKRSSAFARRAAPGDRVDVLFHPARPHDAYVVSVQWVGVGLLALGAAMFGFLAGMVLAGKTRRAR